MPRFSCFTPFGQLAFSSAPSEAEKTYRAMVAGYTDPRDGRRTISMARGTHAEARVYATAMAIAAAVVTTKRAANNQRPESSYEMLLAHGDRFGVGPRANQMVKAYRDEVALAARYPRGSRHEFMIDGLSSILGSALLKYRITTHGEASKWPADPGAGPGVFSRPDVPPKLVRLLGPVTPDTFPSPVSCPYENWDPGEPEILLSVGDVLCVEAEHLGQAEKVTVTSVTGAGGTRELTATFQKAHDQFCSATTGPTPLWFSTRRHIMIVVTAAAAADVELVRRVNAFMHRSVRSVTSWSIVQPVSPGASTMGPFTLNVSPLGSVPIGTVTI